MIDRDYIWVTGTAGAGKTTLLERVLESDRSRILIAGRFSPRATEREAVERVVGEKETLRYEVAGANATFLCSYPPGEDARAEDWYWETAWRRGSSHAVLYEGEDVLDAEPELAVFVMPADPGLLPLVRKTRAEVMRLPFETYLEYLLAAEGQRTPDEEEEALSLPDDRDPELVDDDEEEQVIASFEISDEVAEKLLKWVDEGVPMEAEVWRLRDELSDLRLAQAVVINIRSEDDRPVAERMSAEIQRIWADVDMVSDLRFPRWPKRPPSIYVANLADRRHEGTRKAVARIKRVYQRR